jgi:death-on-curing protein
MKIVCLTKEDIFKFHNKAISVFGGSKEYYIDTEGKIESILSQQYGFFGHDEYPSVFHKAAMLLYYFVKGHCFVDGNKRVGYYAMLAMLRINGYKEHFDNDFGYKSTIKVATSHCRQNEVKIFIRNIARTLNRKCRLG